jgi:hypothetical protein
MGSGPQRAGRSRGVGRQAVPQMSMLPGKKRAEVKQERVKDDWYTENRWAAGAWIGPGVAACDLRIN